MYEQIFNFSSRPFTSAPFVKHYFANESISQALAQTRQCIDRSSGPAIIIGENGTGKSLLLAMLEAQYQTQFSVANLGCVRLDRREDLLQSIMFTLGQPHKGMSEGDLRFGLIDYLKPGDRCPNGVLLLIDEANMLPVELLDEVRLITNFVRDGQSRVRLVLAGNQRLEDKLTDPKLQSLNQRIAARCYLTTMRREETSRYIIEHVDRVGGKGSELFGEQSIKAIHECSDGNPRLVNQICEHALMLAGTKGDKVISEACVREAWADVQGIPGDWSAPETTATDSSTLETDDSWTVIEFGSLDDEPTTSTEESEAETQTVETETETKQPETKQPEPTQEASPQPETPEPTTVDAGLTSATSLIQNGLTAASGLAVGMGAVTETRESTADEAATAEQRETTESVEEEAERPVAEQQKEETQESSDAFPAKRIPQETVDPFAESFEQEEPLADRFAPIVAHQNQSSLDVTSQDLEAIRPLENQPATSGFEVQQRRTEPNTATTNETLDQDDSSSRTEAPTASESERQTDQPATPAARSDIAATITAGELASALGTSNEPEASQEKPDSRRRSAPTIQLKPPGKTQPTVQVIGQLTAETPETTEATPTNDGSRPAQTEKAAPNLSDILKAASSSDQSDAGAASGQAPRKVEPTMEFSTPSEPATRKVEPTLEFSSAGGLLGSVVSKAAGAASAAGAAAAATVGSVNESMKRLSPEEELASSSPEYIEREAEAILERLRQPVQVSHETRPSEPAPAAEGRSPLDESQEILAEILRQKEALANTQIQEPEQRPEESQSINIEYPVGENTGDSSQQDDRNMIVVSRMEQQMESKKEKEPDPIPFPSTPISTGKAERMDYQKLFNQLRDISGEQ